MLKMILIKIIEIADETFAFKDLIGRAPVGRCRDLAFLRKLSHVSWRKKSRGFL
ncbi:hypothetical protein Hanom_Chr03g00195871 [Helianthus anomalus]